MRGYCGGVSSRVIRTSRSDVWAGRVIVYAAAGFEGALVVTFFVSVQLLLNRDYFSLPAAQYGAVYVPLWAAAVVAALFAAKGSQQAARGHVLRLGLTLTAVGRAALIPTILGVVRHAGIFFPDLVIAGALTGAGFALVYSAATAFGLDIDPVRPERPLLRLALTLAAGMVAGPLLQIGLVEAGLWWVFPLMATVLAVLLIAVSSQSRLGPDASRSCALRDPAKRVSVRVKAYLPVAFLTVAALVICVAWSQVGMIGPVTAHIGPRVLGLGVFWAALASLAQAAFMAIDMRASWRRAGTLVLFVLPAAVTVIGLAIGQTETAVVGIFLLAAVTCAALSPSASQLTHRQLLVLPLGVGVGVIGIYPVAIALARPSLAGLRSSGATLPMTFAMTDIVAIVAFVICAGLIASRRAYSGQDGTLAAAHSGAPAAAQATTPADRHLLAQAPPPRQARPCTAVEVPPRDTASREDEDEPGAQSEPRRP
jgi:hypothetical protein